MILIFVESVLILGARWSFSVTSWGRTEKRNSFVRGKPGSLHLLWLAVDVVLDDQKKNIEFEKDADRVGLVAIYEQDHYHLQKK